ncbi:hypothetical protein LIER_26190 [Lithospermum erythrorhizon]|uniref:PROP1-like PPR domain-containing protein n=1 Tax=Lithospermum erythrorhizon TaxID=34254 RepID=A0AAV3R9J8_LITER
MVFKDMKKEHCEPDEYTYTIMIRMTGKAGKPDEALSLFQEMLSKGCTPNLIAFNTILEVLAKSRMIDKAILLFSKMVENKCRPNEFTYSVLLNVLAAEGKLGRLDEIVNISSEYMNKPLYAYLVRTLGKQGHANEAHRLFCNMWSFHDRGDRDAYLSMLESLCTSRKTVEAIDLLSNMHEKGIETDTYMYNLVFSSLRKFKQMTHIRAGRADDAVKIFEKLDSSDCKPDIVSYNSLINCLEKYGNVDEAHMRSKEMQEKGFNPDVVTYSNSN